MNSKKSKAKSKIPFLNEQQVQVLEMLKEHSPLTLYVQEEQFHKDVEDLKELQKLKLITLETFNDFRGVGETRGKVVVEVKTGFHINKTKIWEEEQ